MMFLYFVPGNRSNVQAVEIGYAFDGGKVSQTCETMSGPDGQRGTILANRSVPSQLVGHDKQKQTWRQCGEVWIGYWNDNKPTEKTLKRPVIVPGNAVTLIDGAEWEIPRGLVFDGASMSQTLPRMLDVDSTGEWIIGDVKPDLAKLWEATCQVYDSWIGRLAAINTEDGEVSDTSEVSITFADELAMVELCLQTNYRIGRHEIGMLGLLDRDTPSQVLLALIDWPNYMDYIKKKLPQG